MVNFDQLNLALRLQRKYGKRLVELKDKGVTDTGQPLIGIVYMNDQTVMEDRTYALVDGKEKEVVEGEGGGMAGHVGGTGQAGGEGGGGG